MYNNPKNGMASYYLTEEQDNSATQLSDDPEVLDIRTPQNVQDKLGRTKETEQTITVAPRKNQNTRISTAEASNHKVVQTDERNRYVCNNVFDTLYKDYIEFKYYINDILNSFNTNNRKDSVSKKNDDEISGVLNLK